MQTGVHARQTEQSAFISDQINKNRLGVEEVGSPPHSLDAGLFDTEPRTERPGATLSLPREQRDLRQTKPFSETLQSRTNPESDTNDLSHASLPSFREEFAGELLPSDTVAAESIPGVAHYHGTAAPMGSPAAHFAAISARAANQSGIANASAGRFAAAALDFERAASLNPTNSEYADNFSNSASRKIDKEHELMQQRREQARREPESTNAASKATSSKKTNSAETVGKEEAI